MRCGEGEGDIARVLENARCEGGGVICGWDGVDCEDGCLNTLNESG